ncbi:MAG: ATP-binding protein [Pseudomonadota bacterium]
MEILKKFKIKSESAKQGVSLQTHKNIITEFLQSITLIVDKEILCNSIIAKIHEIFKFNNIYLFLTSEPSGDFYLKFKFSAKPKSIFLSFSQEGKFIKWLRTNETFIAFKDTQDIYNYFNKNEKDNLETLKINYCFPLVSMNSLIGFILCDKKNGTIELSEDEMNLIFTLCGQAALAIKSSFLLEEQKLKLAKMLTADRLVVAGQLAAGAAHEIKNPLTSIRSTIQYLTNKTENEKSKELLSGLIEEVDRIDEIVRGLLSFARKEKEDFREFNLKVILEETINFIKPTMSKKQIEVIHEFNAANEAFFGDKNQIKQVILNLILNASEAIKNDGKIIIAVSYEESSKAKEIKGWFSLRIIDTGPGINPEVIDKIFDPFFTTKDEGSGLGLFTIYGLIERHQGDITIEKSDKSGTTFLIRLPFKS